MQLNITIPDDVAPQLINHVCTTTGFDPAGTLTKRDHVKAVLIRQLRQMAANGAGRTASADVKAALDAADIN